MYYIKTAWCPEPLKSKDWKDVSFDPMRIIEVTKTAVLCVCETDGFSFVAKKYVKGNTTTFKQAKNIINEMECHAILFHPHILPLYGVFENECHIYLLMELARIDLRDFLNKKITFAQSLHTELQFNERYIVEHILCPIVHAIAHMNQLRIIHRDIKPENIVLGFDGRWKLCDFGYALHLAVERTASFVGTEGYVPPETSRSFHNHENSEKGDIWSFGILASELLCNFIPETYEDLINTPFKEHLDSDAREFVEYCLEFQPKVRKRATELLRHPFLLRHTPERSFSICGRGPCPISRNHHQTRPIFEEHYDIHDDILISKIHLPKPKSKKWMLFRIFR